jgi:RHS repeat-associated protein
VYNYYMSVQLPEACSLPSQGTGNNGNVRGLFYQDAAHPGLQHSEAFSYDGVNRLTGAVATGSQTYNLTYSYDTYGNMSCVLNQQTQGPCAQVTYTSENKNQLATIAGGAVSYDAAGNLTQDASQVPPCSYTWDAESRLKTVSGCQSDARVYNALGQVAELAAPNGNLIESLYGTGGEELGRFYSFGTWLYTRVNAAGRMLASYGPINGTWYTRFFHVNALGSMTGMTQQAGGLYSDALYYPWGQFWTYRNLQVPSRFAGLEQVVETSFDSTTDLLTSPTRNLNTSSGRWLTPDPDNAGADESNPQSWNGYSYVLNDPATNTDPDGLDCLRTSNQTSSSVTVIVDRGACSGEGGTYINGTIDMDSLKYDPQHGQISFSYEDYGGGQVTGVHGLPGAGETLSAEDRANVIFGIAGPTAAQGIKHGAAAMAINGLLMGAGRLVGLGLDAPAGADLSGLRPGGRQLKACSPS